MSDVRLVELNPQMWGLRTKQLNELVVVFLTQQDLVGIRLILGELRKIKLQLRRAL